MTREGAINLLYGMRADNLNLNDLYTREKYEALGIAIEALENENTLIDRVLENVEACFEDAYSNFGEEAELMEQAADMLEKSIEISAVFDLIKHQRDSFALIYFAEKYRLCVSVCNAIQKGLEEKLKEDKTE